MMSRITFLFLFSFINLIYGISGCYVEPAQPTKENQLVIVSDYLQGSDTILFQKFEEKHNINVIIRTMKANELIGYMRNARHNSGLDIIMMKSLYDVLHLHKQDVLHQFGENEKMFNLDTSYISINYNFAGIGFDPFLISRSNDSVPEVLTIKDLGINEHFSTLTEEDKVVLLSDLRKKLGRASFYSWGKKWLPKNRPIDLHKIDSLPNLDLPILGLSSDSESIDSLLKNKAIESFLTDEEGLNPYNLRTICIINQSEHYTLAKKFISFYRNPGHNDDLSINLNLIPLFYTLSEKEYKFIPNTSTPEKLMQYYTITERIIKKLDN